MSYEALDSKARARALDTRASFIVQAPAGSGKTELLIQRFLKLLAVVERPEEVVALTFTRKAANEMRFRIFKALNHASNLDIKPQIEHEALTWSYAKEVLAQDAKLNWDLLNNIDNLRIMTIDALCQKIVNTLPLLTKDALDNRVCDEPWYYYTKASRETINYAANQESYYSSIELLLLHLDNRQDLLINLFNQLLATREQWLFLVYDENNLDKQQIEKALSNIEKHQLIRLNKSLSSYGHELKQFLHEYFQILGKDNIFLKKLIIDNIVNDNFDLTVDVFTNFKEKFNKIESIILAQLIITKDCKLRKSFDHNIGLKKGICSDEVYKSFKQNSKEMLAALDNIPEFLEILLTIKSLPEPVYDIFQWQVLQSICRLLPLLYAQLKLIFKDHKCVDFQEISLQALLALGTPEEPTQINLYFDYAIKHLLIDEFQDTSIAQYNLLTKLVQTWDPSDQKTLFLVGDPMQSIYGFRGAEVGLFLHAKNYGIADVKLNFLLLQKNFRSVDKVVTWNNNLFANIFPKNDDIEIGAVAFAQSMSTIPADEKSLIKAYACGNDLHEALATIEILQETLAKYPEDNIAILVRSRSILSNIIAMLKNYNISYQGVNIDFLANLSHIQDLWTLTQLILFPSNRLLWFSFLRSPYVGILLEDLHKLANIETNESILSLLVNNNFVGLSADAQIRLSFVSEIFKNIYNSRAQRSLLETVQIAHKEFNGNFILNLEEQKDLDAFWQLLAREEEAFYINDLEEFEKSLNKLYATNINDAKVHIMTIHKAKGLEFDTVILPGLSQKSAAVAKPLLRWLKLPKSLEGEIHLLSPIKSSAQEHDKLYNFIGKIEAEKQQYEMQRLLYVALTRAKKRLYLLDNTLEINKNTSLRGLIKHIEFLEYTPKLKLENNIANILDTPIANLKRLPVEFFQRKKSFIAPEKTIITFEKSNQATIIGVIIHELLQWICESQISNFDNISWHHAERQLKQLGFIGDVYFSTLKEIKDKIYNIFQDSWGLWIISKHDNEQNEYPLLCMENGIAKTYVLDRTFVFENRRWIIDFKTGADNTKYVIDNHKLQVNKYAKLFKDMQELDIMCGIYYLTQAQWVQWEYIEPTTP